MDEVFKQAPENMTYEEVELIYNANDKNTLKTLFDLWKIQETNIKNISEIQCKWANIRDICDEYDNEMKNTIEKAKNASVT